jgi:hypothetical protein
MHNEQAYREVRRATTQWGASLEVPAEFHRLADLFARLVIVIRHP